MELFVAFVLGIASSGIVAYVVYRRQRKESAQSERRLAALVEEALDSTKYLRFTIGEVRSDQSEIRQDIEKLMSAVVEAPGASSHRGTTVVRDVARDARITIDEILKLHATLLPERVAHRGELRNTRVRVVGATYQPPDAEEVPRLLEELIAWWNADAASGIQQRSDEEVALTLAKFHHRLVFIHPFFDGNGTVARALLAAQLQQIVGKMATDLFVDRTSYYHALEAADAGDMTPLQRMILLKIRELTSN